MMYKTSHLLKHLFVIVVLALATAACDSSVTPTEGPVWPRETHVVSGTAADPKVTLYIFDGHDFSASSIARRCVPLDTEAQHAKSAWLYFLQDTDGNRFPVPGVGPLSLDEYRVRANWDLLSCPKSWHEIAMESGGFGVNYSGIRIFRLVANRITNPPGLTAGARAEAEPLIPEDLDISDYDAVLEHFGISEEDAAAL